MHRHAIATRGQDRPAATTIARSRGPILLLLLPLALLGACAQPVKPPPPPEPEPVAPVVVIKDHAAELRAAYDQYKQGQFAPALAAFEAVIADTEGDAGSKRTAWLGKALVYLGSDKQLRSVKNASAAVTSASAIAIEGDTAASANAAFLTSAIESLIKLEGDSTDAGGRVARLTKEKAALTEERNKLLAEQAKLKEALEKLKKLSLEK